MLGRWLLDVLAAVSVGSIMCACACLSGDACANCDVPRRRERVSRSHARSSGRLVFGDAPWGEFSIYTVVAWLLVRTEGGLGSHTRHRSRGRAVHKWKVYFRKPRRRGSDFGARSVGIVLSTNDLYCILYCTVLEVQYRSTSMNAFRLRESYSKNRAKILTPNENRRKNGRAAPKNCACTSGVGKNDYTHTEYTGCIPAHLPSPVSRDDMLRLQGTCGRSAAPCRLALSLAREISRFFLRGARRQSPRRPVAAPASKRPVPVPYSALNRTVFCTVLDPYSYSTVQNIFPTLPPLVAGHGFVTWQNLDRFEYRVIGGGGKPTSTPLLDGY